MFSLNGQDLVHHKFTVDDGLSSSNVYKAIQDKKGFLWFSTDMGISRFDGYSFRNFSVKDGLLNNDVWEMYESKDGKIWLSSFDSEATYIEYDSIHVFPLNIEQKSDNLSRIYVEGEDGKMYTTDYRNYILEIDEGESSFIFNRENTSIHPRTMQSIILPYLGNGSLLAVIKSSGKNDSDKKELYHLDRSGQFIFIGNLTIKKATNYLLNRVFAIDRDSLIYFSNRTAQIFGSNQTKIIKLEFLPKNRDVDYYQISYVPKIGFLFCSDEGNYLVNDQFELHSIAAFIKDKRLNSIFQDKDQNFWLLTKGQGIFFIPRQGKNSKTWSVGQEIDDQQVTSLSIDPKGRLWLGTGTGQLLFLEDDKLHQINFNDKIKKRRRGKIRKLHIDQNGILMAVFDNYGLVISNTNTINPKHSTINIHTLEIPKYKLTAMKSLRMNPPYNHFPYFSPKSISGDEYGNWLSTGARGAIQIIKDGDSFNFIIQNNVRAYASVENHKKQLWIGQTDGLFELYQNEYMTLRDAKERDPLLTKSIGGIECDEFGNPWVATNGHGLYLFYDGRSWLIDETKLQNIKSIFIDSNQQIWASSNVGLFRIKVKSYKPFDYQIQNFNTSNGLLSNEINAVYVSDSIAYVGTGKGLNSISLSALKESSSDFPLNINSIKIANRDTTILDKYDLAYNQNSLTISYVGLSFGNKENIIYQYKMEGIDTTWLETEALERDYPTLPPGHNYSFHLRAKKKDNTYSDQYYKIHFNIKKPWWTTTYFLILMLILIGSLIYLYYRSRVRNIQNKAAEKTEINRRLAAFKLQTLQAQMNPHFIFNSLQAIQDFIARHDERSTNKYLSNFSRLMRLFLESSTNERIALNDEVDLLRFYLELEQLRFERPFEFQLDLPEDLDSSTIEVPSMLIQPFIENAINHGLKFLKSQGKIYIGFRERNGWLEVTVEDNGVGREQSKIIQQQNRAFPSRSTQIIQDRLEAISLWKEQSIQIQITDLISENRAAGTRVIIKIQLID